jgi:hypothetical protein
MDNVTYKTTDDVKPILSELSKTAFHFLSLEKNIYKHSLIVIGIVNRTHELTDTALWSIDNDRPHSSALALRGLIETLAFTFYFIEQVYKNGTNAEKLDRLLFGSRTEVTEFESVNVLSCIDRAVKMFPQLRQSYDDLSEMAHPNANSLFYVGTPEGELGHVKFSIPFYTFKGKDKIAILNQTGECCFHVNRLLNEMTQVLEKAKKMKV